MAPALAIALTVLIVLAVTVPSWWLGKRLGTPLGQRNASAEEQAERKRERAVRRKAEFAALRTPERVLFFAYYGLCVPAIPLGALLTIYGRGTSRTVGAVLLILAVLLMAVPVGPILSGRVRRRKRAGSGSGVSETN